MFRKVTLALAALAVIGAAALAPTAASAGWKGKHFGHHWGYKHYYNTGYYGYGYNCWVKRWVHTYYGPVLKRFYVCY